LQRKRSFVDEDVAVLDNVAKSAFQFRMSAHGVVKPDWTPKPGFLYTQVRAIAARINQNYDAWPSAELKKYYKTFIGKPVFVNHMNEDPTKARGVVVAARYVEGKGGDNYVEVIQEIDAKRFPKLAHEIRTGGLDGVSMGVEAGFTICSVCDGRATDLSDMCDHVMYHKGSTMRHAKTGEKTLVYERCYKLGFFELSYVFDPADETALVSRVIMAHNKAAAYNYNHPPTPRRDPKYNRPRNKTLNDTKSRWVTDAEQGDSPDVDLSEPDPFDPESYHMAGIPKEEFPITHRETEQIWSPKSKAYQDHAPPNVIKRLRDPSDTQIYDNASIEEKAYLDPLDFYSPYKVPKENWKAPGIGPHRTSRWFNSAPAPTKSVKRTKHAYYGETVAPEDIDTLRDESEDDTDDFHHWVASPPELRKPDLDQSQRLDKAQEDQGMDADRQVENVEEQSAPAPDDPTGQEIGNQGSTPFLDDEPENEDEPVMPINPPQTKSSRWYFPKENRMARYLYAEDEGYDGDEGYDDDDTGGDSGYEDESGHDDGGYPDEGGDDFGGDEGSDPFGGDAGGDPFGGGDPSQDPSQDPSAGGDPADLDDVHQLLDQAASAIDEYRQQADAGGDDFGDDGSGDPFGGGDTGYEDPSGGDFGGDEGQDPYADPSQDPSAGADPSQDPHADPSQQEDLPPWLAQASNSRTVTKRRARRNSRGGNMRTTLANRNPGARHFTADDNGHTDGGPYGVDDSQGRDEDIFISQVPGAEAVEAPTPGDGQISNSKGNLVARRSQFDPAHYQRLADTVASMPIQQRKAVAQEMVRAFTADNKRFNAVTFYKEAGVPMVKKGSRYFFAEELTDPDKVNPELSGTDADVKSGDFESLALDNVETQPKDASVHAFRQFDAWLKKVTGRNSREHGNANYISRAAASYCNQYGNQRTAALNSLFPTLEYVLREARKIEGRTATMNRYAEDESLSVAAPQGRIDVEAPVKNVTDAEAQASQFDLGDFAHNAGDQIADPELDVVDGNAGTWAPDKGKESSVKLASGTEAMRCAEAYVAAMPNTYSPEDRWRLASMFETLRQPYVRREIRLLEAVLADRKTRTARNKVAAVGSRGTNVIPSGLGSRRTAGASAIRKDAAANPETDSFVLFM